ncbi:PrsW family glutamic-type intramembrane protease [Ruminococcus albus]|uniref:PrsW family glutamic-type intramembrane protease n=1 Tax=Ruminococcus albus TaxID=1264 RepID=UPI0015A529CF|nr:PrsW family glutamic-type intramembrane protease [Ruminococcus albus]
MLKKTPAVKKEPFKRVAKVFIVSALSTIVAIILELIGMIILANIYKSDVKGIMSMSGIFALCLFIIGPSEEICKYFTFKLTIFKNRDFDHTYDGVIYGAAAALGFATLENILYVLGNSSQSGALMGAYTGILRAVLSVPLHAFTGILMGYKFGISKYIKYNNVINAVHNKNPQRLAFILSVAVHGLYDFLAIASNATDAPEGFVYVSIAGVIGIMILVYVLMYKIINKASKEDLMIYNEYYYQHLNGHFQDMVGKTNENGIVLVNPDNVQNFVTNAYGSQPNTMAGQPVVWQYGSIPNNNTDQQSGGYPYGNAQNGQYGYQPQNNYQPHNTYQQPGNVNPYSQGQYGGYPAENTYQPQQNAYQSRNSDTYVPGIEPVSPTYTPNQSVHQTYTPTQTQAQVQQPEKASFCTECGNRLSADAKFCTICGNKI